MSRSYNGSIFDIRYHFKKIFPECKYKYADHGHGGKRKKSVDFSTVFKINYSINLLPSFGEYVKQDLQGHNHIVNSEYKFTKVCEASDDIDMLDLAPMTELIDYKWKSYGFKWHIIGSIFHSTYLILLYIYIQFIYLHDPYTDFEDV